ncbi:MAG: hypothetical protein U5L04_02355 [Trueperaceae bacterium]|nr:hypothetical protein [Trueperaceae bacterium]
MSTLWLILLAFGPAVATGALVEAGAKGLARVTGTTDLLDRVLPIVPLVVGVCIALPLTPLVRSIVVDVQFGGEMMLGGTRGAAVWYFLLGLHGFVSGAISGQCYEVLKEHGPEKLRDALDWWKR